jgi:hypothetical protein
MAALSMTGHQEKVTELGPAAKKVARAICAWRAGQLDGRYLGPGHCCPFDGV